MKHRKDSRLQLQTQGVKMKITTIISVLIFALGINSAVFLHHFFKEKEIESKHKNSKEIKLISPKRTTPYIFHYAGEEKWNNVFATYRLNKETGKILRYSHKGVKSTLVSF